MEKKRETEEKREKLNWCLFLFLKDCRPIELLDYGFIFIISFSLNNILKDSSPIIIPVRSGSQCMHFGVINSNYSRILRGFHRESQINLVKCHSEFR